MTTTTTNSIFTVWDAVHEIAIMLAEEYTSAEVRAAAETLRRIKAELWEAERFTDQDSTKLLGTSIWTLDHAADEMDRIFGTIIMSDEAEDDLTSDIEWAIEEMWTNLPSISEKHECFDAEDYYENTEHDTDDPDDLYEIDDEDRSPVTDTDLSDILGDFAWQYDDEAVLDMLTIVTPTGTFWLRDDETPSWDEIDKSCIWNPTAEVVSHIMDWYNSHADEEVVDIDAEMVLDALTISVDGEREWMPLTGSQVDDIIYDIALLTSDNTGTLPADEICDEHLDEMYEVLAWADVTPWIDSDEDITLGRLWFAMTTNHGVFPVWRHLTRSQVAEIADDILA